MLALPIVGREGLGPRAKREYFRGRTRFTGAYSISENDESYSVPYRILSFYEREEPADEPWPTPYSCIRDMTIVYVM